MKSWIKRGLPVLIFLPVFLSALQFPKYRGWVNDFANVIPSAEETRMTAIAQEVKRKTGAEIAVVTVPDMQGLGLEDYANRLYREWGIGSAEKDDGVLILLAMQERKLRIETGYGVEGILPDGKTGGIMDQYMIPPMQQGDFGTGLLAGMTAVTRVIAEDAGVTISGSENMQTTRRPARRSSGRGGCFPVIFVILLIILTRGRIIPWLLLGSMMGGGRSGGGFSGGGGFGGGFGGGGASRGF